jgi:CspA family cold shock protein
MVSLMARGKVVRFDQVKGYGFVAPLEGGEDVFLHANDLMDDKSLIRTGATVEYVLEYGDRGPKASSVHLVSRARDPGDDGPVREVQRRLASSSSSSSDDPDSETSEEDFVDVLSERNYLREVTEALLVVEPGLTGAQIRATRLRLLDVAKRYGWVDD